MSSASSKTTTTSWFDGCGNLPAYKQQLQQQQQYDGCCNFPNLTTVQQQQQQQQQDNDDEDRQLAQELNALSFQQREQILDEIHGVAEPLVKQETPQFVSDCIQKLNEAIPLVPQRKRAALDRAFFLKPSLQTNDVKFKLMFLRANEYDANKAAKSMAQYFYDKLGLFGEANLVKKITLDDLSVEEMELFQRGVFTVLPCKDRSGRPISFVDCTKLDFTHEDCMLRCFWYNIMSNPIYIRQQHKQHKQQHQQQQQYEKNQDDSQHEHLTNGLDSIDV